MAAPKSDTVSIHAAKTHLSQLIARVEAGEVITIARGDKPVARLAPIAPDKPKREFGKWKHLIGGIPPEFFDPLPEEELDAWEGGDSDEFGISLPKKE